MRIPLLFISLLPRTILAQRHDPGLEVSLNRDDGANKSKARGGGTSATLLPPKRARRAREQSERTHEEQATATNHTTDSDSNPPGRGNHGCFRRRARVHSIIYTFCALKSECVPWTIFSRPRSSFLICPTPAKGARNKVMMNNVTSVPAGIRRLDGIGG